MTLACCAVTLIASACSSEGPDDSTDPATTLPQNVDLDRIAAAIGCMQTADISEMVNPIRGGAATSGVACELPSGTVHLFARAPRGDPAEGVRAMGGLTDNIDRVLMTNEAPDPTCPAEVVIGESYFAVSDSPASLAVLEHIAGHVERSATPTAPMTSYLARPCHTGLNF
jgi:hypothetical protein